MAHMLFRSCRDVRRPRYLPNATTAAILQSHPDETTKNKLCFSETPRRGDTLKSGKNRQKIMHFSFLQTRYIMLTSYEQKSNPTCLFVVHSYMACIAVCTGSSETSRASTVLFLSRKVAYYRSVLPSLKLRG